MNMQLVRARLGLDRSQPGLTEARSIATIWPPGRTEMVTHLGLRDLETNTFRYRKVTWIPADTIHTNTMYTCLGIHTLPSGHLCLS